MYIKVVSRLSLASVAYDSSTVSLYGPSVVHLSAQTDQVTSSHRQGNDLVMVLNGDQGGKEVVRIQDYFAFVSDGENASELVLDSGDQLVKYSFSEAEMTEEKLLADGNENGILLDPTVEPVADIDELLVGENDSLVASLGNWLGSLSPTAWGIGLGGILLAGGAAVALMDDDDDSNSLEKKDSSDTATAPVTFDAVMDDEGDSQGALKDGDTTDDRTPTFNGTGEPGASIQINDANGETLASTQVAEDGTWTVSLPSQEDGDHHYQIVQIVGDDVQQGDSIDITIEGASEDPVDTPDPVLGIGPVSDDDVVTTSELQDGILVSGTATGVDAGSTMIITLNGKSYNTELNTDGSWEIELPGETVTDLSTGEHELMLTVLDDAGEAHSTQRTLLVEDAAAALSADVDELSIDLSDLLDGGRAASITTDGGFDSGHDVMSIQSSSFDMAALLEGSSLPLV